MNLGFSGPIEDKEVEALKDLELMVAFGHRRRTKAPAEPDDIDGGIVDVYTSRT